MSSDQNGNVTNHQFIRSQVLCGLALNREAGYHFVGNFLEISFDRIATEDARLSLDTAPHCVEAGNRSESAKSSTVRPQDKLNGAD